MTMLRDMLKIVLHADNFELLAQRVHAEVDDVIGVFSQEGENGPLWF